MNKEMLLKLLKSEREDDNLIALNVLRGRNTNNWGAFELELYELIRLETYTYINPWKKQVEVKLPNKYFDPYKQGRIKPKYYELID